jgi:citrate lyase subunit beta/citryl-CoA lyase
MTLDAIRSLLFVPADDPDRLTAAFGGAADAVVADLEDFVPADRKDAARAVVSERLAGFTGAARLVRVNAPETGLTDRDLDAIRGIPLDAVLVPKASRDSVEAVRGTGAPVIAVIETAQGLREAYEVAAAPHVVALALGAGDLTAALALEPRPDALELLYARSKLVVDSSAAGIRAPFDRVFAPLTDLAGLRADALLARSLGFGGKSCTHPGQPQVVNEVFAAGRARPDKSALFEVSPPPGP